jgi:hypothetical protein
MTRDEEDEVIYAVALVTKNELSKLGGVFARAWPVELTPCFGELVAAIDDADSEYAYGQHREDLRYESADRARE